jgi:hypothetical protein
MIARNRENLVGSWRLESVSALNEGGDRNNEPFGNGPKGSLTYTAGGRMTVMISYGGRKPLSTEDRILATAEEKIEAFSTFFAYSGRYSLLDDRVIHHVDISSVENWVNTDLVRLIDFSGDRITLRTPLLLAGGKNQIIELVWERMI